MDTPSLIAVGAVCIASMIIVALFNGIDGVLLVLGISAIISLITGTTTYKIGLKKGRG